MHEIIVSPDGMTNRELANSIRSLQVLLTVKLEELEKWVNAWTVFHERVHQYDIEQRDRDARQLRDKFESINEVRAQLGTQKAEFATREYVDTKLEALSSRLNAVEKSSTTAAAERAATAATFRWIILAIGFIGTMLGILTTILILVK